MFSVIDTCGIYTLLLMELLDRKIENRDFEASDWATAKVKFNARVPTVGSVQLPAAQPTMWIRTGMPQWPYPIASYSAPWKILEVVKKTRELGEWGEQTTGFGEPAILRCSYGYP